MHNIQCPDSWSTQCFRCVGVLFLEKSRNPDEKIVNRSSQVNVPRDSEIAWNSGVWICRDATSWRVCKTQHCARLALALALIAAKSLQIVCSTHVGSIST